MKGYFFVADLLGFKEIVKNLSVAELPLRYEEYSNLVDEAKSHASIENVQIFSDTVMAASSSTSEGLKKLLIFSQYLLNVGIKKSILFRGAITYGEYEWKKNQTYGLAAVHANEMEKSQEWIGITCHHSLPHILELYHSGLVVCYTSPMKKEKDITIYPVVAWDIPSSNELIMLSLSGGLSVKGENLKYDWGKKLDNTVQFKLYLNYLNENGLDGSTYHGVKFGSLPIQLIEAQITKQNCLLSRSNL